MKTQKMASIGLALMTVVCGAVAQGASEADQMREELRQIRRDYEERIRKLEERLQRMEGSTNATGPGAGQAFSTNALSPRKASTPQPASAMTNAAAVAREFAAEEFREDTESRDRALLQESGPLRERMEEIMKDFMDIHGYFRAGYGRDDEGGPQVAFQAPGAFSKYRLGNEAENYGELAFGKNFYLPGAFKLGESPNGVPGSTASAGGIGSSLASPENRGPVARVQAMLSVYNPYQDLLSSGGTEFGMPEAFASIGNVVASQPAMKFWAGSRYYRRHDIHISDFFFYNMSGSGGGVEDIQLPFGKLSAAWIGAGASSGFSDLPQPDAENEAGFSKANWDLRLHDVEVPFGKGEIGLVISRADSGKDADGNTGPDATGFSVNFLHTRDKFLSEDGFNKISAQFGTGPARTFTSGFETITLTNGVYIRPEERDSWRLRFTEHFTAELSPAFSIGPALVYQLTDYGDLGGKVQWASAGLRPIWHFNKYISLALEAGVDWVKNDEAGTSDYLYKVTLAPQVSLGRRFMSRPVIRAFVTYGHWGDDFVGQVGGFDYSDRNQGVTFGVQMEAWW